ncbi:MAG: hypothetical protein HYW48_02045 [Deltaproteobacteria bacterium]|nr:hypothetical protein [Deltaproteobacteria bacterium]
MEETPQLVPPRNPLGERPFALLRAGFSLAPPTPPLPICPKWLTHYEPIKSPLANGGVFGYKASKQPAKIT